MQKGALYFAVCLSGLMCTPATGGENQSSLTTSGNSASRYEIIQSELAARNTFRVDKFCGAVAELVVDEAGINHWQNMPIETQPACQNDGHPHYQLFTSGLAARFTFLMNTSTGRTWQLVVDDKQNRSWELLQ